MILPATTTSFPGSQMLLRLFRQVQTTYSIVPDLVLAPCSRALLRRGEHEIWNYAVRRLYLAGLSLRTLHGMCCDIPEDSVVGKIMILPTTLRQQYVKGTQGKATRGQGIIFSLTSRYSSHSVSTEALGRKRVTRSKRENNKK